MNCPCGSTLTFTACCEIVHKNPKEAKSAEMLMRARYSAFTLHNIDFIYQTFHPSTRRYQSLGDIKQWAIENKWMNLEILNSTVNTVEFKAHYLDVNLNPEIHHEKSNFKQIDDTWYYVDGKLT